MKIAFWGLGSIAKRHIKNLDPILQKKGIPYQIDVYRHGNAEIEDESIGGIVTKSYLMQELVDQQYDIIFITNPTALHMDAMKQCANHTRHMFIEKPVFCDGNVDLKTLPLKKDAAYYVACPLRYTAVLQYIKNNVDLEDVCSVRAISSSYLPDWRPGTDYRDTYSAHRELGGGVSIDLIHEWDYLTFLFGYPEKVLHAGGRFSNLEIDSDDIAAYIGIYKDKLIELHLDYFGRSNTREVTLFTETDVIHADFLTGIISSEKSGQIIDCGEDRDEYQRRELEHFLDIIDGECINDNTLENACRCLRLARPYDMEVVL